MVHAWIAGFLAGCGAPLVPEPLPVAAGVDLVPPWHVETRSAAAIVVRIGETADGVRIQLAPDERNRAAGVSPILGGRTLELEAEGRLVPLVEFPSPALSKVDVSVDGVDLVVRVEGPPLSALTVDGSADPVLTWVRLRPRGDSWRVVVDGLSTLHLPADTSPAITADGALSMTSGWGPISFDSNAPGSTSGADREHWWWTNRPSLALHQPYPRTALTLQTRPTPSPHPP